ncbi:YadA-like family protein, partial [Escherichia coli]
MDKSLSRSVISVVVGGILFGASASVLAQTVTVPDLPYYSVLKEADVEWTSVKYGSTYRIYYNASSDWGTMRYIADGKNEVLFNFDKDGNIYTLSKDGVIGYTIHEPVLKGFAEMAEQSAANPKMKAKDKQHKVDEEEVRRITNKINNISNTVVNPALKNQVGELSGRVDKIDLAAGALAADVAAKTTVGVNSDGTLTRAEGASKTLAVNDGLVALSGRTDRIDAAVGSVDRRVTKNTQAIQSNSRQLQEHNTRLNSHQRQINENHEEMKR